MCLVGLRRDAVLSKSMSSGHQVSAHREVKIMEKGVQTLQFLRKTLTEKKQFFKAIGTFSNFTSTLADEY